MIQITGLVDMYFDAVVVEVQTFLLLFRLALAILCQSTKILVLIEGVLNPNWHETGHFYLLVILGLDFVS